MDSVIERIIAADEMARQTVTDAKKAKDTANVIIDEKKAALEKEYANKANAEIAQYRSELEISVNKSESDFEERYKLCSHKLETAGKENILFWSDNIADSIIKKLSVD